ncbi:hypothetical protein ACFE04_010057 [Oxalis oulophora]
MGDHFVLLVNRLLSTNSTSEPSIEIKRQSDQVMPLVSKDNIVIEFCSQPNVGVDSSLSKFVECRICQDEDEDINMETPCSCRGTLEYAHRKCVQRWCNEKGDTICEICHQQFKPGYTAPPPSLFDFGDYPMNFGENGEIFGRDLHNSQFITMLTTESNFYQHCTPRTLICYRIIAVTFIVLLILRHTLPVIIYGTEESSAVLMLILLRMIGIVLPIYLMFKAFKAIKWRLYQHHQQDPTYYPHY